MKHGFMEVFKHSTELVVLVVHASGGCLTPKVPCERQVK